MVSINEIANRLGLSRNTVSKVINDKGGVSEETRNLVLQTALNMGYKKLNISTELNKIQHNISVLVNNPEFSSFWMKMINTIAAELRITNNNFVYNYVLTKPSENFELPSIILNKGISGIIVINIYDNSIIDLLTETNIPVVYYDTTISSIKRKVGGDIVLTEGESAVYQITKHIIEKGITKFGFIGDINYSRTIYERYKGFKQALEDNNLNLDYSMCIIKGKINYLYNENELEKNLKLMKKLPQAFICANDAIAYMTVKYLKKRGIKTPDDIYISGFDNIQESLTKENTLTTVNVNVDYIAKKLVKMVLERIDEPNKPYEYTRIYTEPIFRKSTGDNL